MTRHEATAPTIALDTAIVDDLELLGNSYRTVPHGEPTAKEPMPVNGFWQDRALFVDEIPTLSEVPQTSLVAVTDQLDRVRAKEIRLGRRAHVPKPIRNGYPYPPPPK